MAFFLYYALVIYLCVHEATSFGGLELHALQEHAMSSVTHHSAILASSNLDPLSAGTELLSKYKESLVNNPLQTKMATGATLAIMGDAIAQSREPEEYDIRRAASFGVFDSAYRATQHFLFPPIVQYCQGQYFLGGIALVPPLAKFVSETMDPTYFAAMEQTLASQLGIVPFIYYPVFFALTGVVQGLSVEGAVNRAKENFIPLMQRNLLFWIPVQFVQFGFIEESLQIPFLSVCGLCWTFILSVMAGSTKTYSQSPENETATEQDPYSVTVMESACDQPEDLRPSMDFKPLMESEKELVMK